MSVADHGEKGAGTCVQACTELLERGIALPLFRPKLVSAMIRKAFLMSVHPGQETEYERRHRPIWRELEAVLKAHGVHNYSIFLHPETRQLFGYAEIEDEARWSAIAQTPECRRWWKFMGDIMPANPDNSPVASELKEMFHLE